MPQTLEELTAELGTMKEQVSSLAASNSALVAKGKELKAEKIAVIEKAKFLADKLGIDAADESAVEAAAAMLESARNPDAKKSVRDDKAIEKVRQQLTAELEAAKKDGGVWRSRFESAQIQRDLSEAMAAEDGIAELLMPMLLGQVRVVQDGDTFRTQVFDADGEPRLAAGKPVTPRQLVQTIKADAKFGGAFKASGASGSGATNPGQRPKNRPMTSVEKIAAGLAAMK